MKLTFGTIFALAATALTALPAQAQQLTPEIFTLENGMKFVLIPRTDEPNTISAGWLAKVGSANERPGITGISHFFSSTMFLAGIRTTHVYYFIINAYFIHTGQFDELAFLLVGDL